MQKSKQELNVNVGGALMGDPQIKNQKGITLIALIITIIVMLILVGVALNIALNGGLFGKAEKATYQTEASTVKEQLELAKVLKRIENGGKSVEDYSDITVADLEDLDSNTQSKFENKIVVNKAGYICYNPEEVTDQEEKTWLEEIGIKAYVNEPKQEKGLVYGKIYKGTWPLEGETTIEMPLSFSEKYGVVFPGDAFYEARKFIYEEQSKTITIDGMGVFNLSEDGTVISNEMFNIELQLTDEEIFSTYNVEYLSEINAYSGLYYNESVPEFIGIFVDDNGHIKYAMNGNTSNTFGTSVIDSKHIEREGNIYTLIETLE